MQERLQRVYDRVVLRTPPRSTALTRLAVLGAALTLASTPAQAASCGNRLELQAQYYAWAMPGYAFCVATGDWDEDGRPDVAVAHGGSSLTTMLGRAGFRLASREEIPLDIDPRWLVAHDMNGDGHLDLVVTGDGGTRILAGDGRGAFRETESFAEAGGRVTVGDLDGDGRADIVLASYSTPQLTVIFRGSGERFALQGNRYGAYFAVLADFDHDGDLDLASAGTLVWLNDGRGHFSGPASYPTLYCQPQYMAAGDVNGDGNPDLFGVTTREGGGGGCDMLLLGNGDGTFRGAATIPAASYAHDPRPPRRPGTTGSDGGPGTADPHTTPESPRHIPPGPEFVVLADLNGDGHDDPVRIGGDRGYELNGRLSLYGAGMACAADMDLDGKLDIVVAGYRAIAIHPGNGDGTFRWNLSTETYYPPSDAELADLDGDGRRDVAVTTFDTDELVVALTAPDGGFKRIIRNQISPDGGRMVIADFDGDGRADLVDGYGSLYFGNGDGTFRMPPVADAPFGIPGDFNEDGHVDVASALGHSVRISFGNGDGTFRAGPEIVVEALELKAADVDHDGHLDLMVAAGTFASVIYGKGDGTAAEIVSLPTETIATPLTWGDFDGDGRLDVILPSLQGAAVYLGRGRTFVRSPYTGAPRGAIVGDLDGDGILDLMAGDVWFGVGDGTFEHEDGLYGPGGATFIDDRNGDGLGDVVAIGSYDEDGYENLITLIPNRTIRDRAPITSDARASVAHTWPPNGDFADVSITGVTDPDADPVSITCLGVTQDEPVSGNRERASRRQPVQPDSSCADAVIGADGRARVRLSRDGSGNGRVYEITFSAADACGATSVGRVRVDVPHDPGKLCIDDGQRFSSLACASAFSAQEAVADSRPLAVERLSADRWAIRYSLAAPAEIRLDVFDLLGRRIATLESGRRGTGLHESVWNSPPRDGIFFVRLTKEGQTQVRRCVVLD